MRLALACVIAATLCAAQGPRRTPAPDCPATRAARLWAAERAEYEATMGDWDWDIDVKPTSEPLPALCERRCESTMSWCFFDCLDAAAGAHRLSL